MDLHRQPQSIEEMGRSKVHSVVKALRVVEALVGSEPIGVTELATRLSLPKASVQRLLETLSQEGWARPVRNGPTRWVPGEAMVALAASMNATGDIRAIARPALEELRRQTNESASLYINAGQAVVLVDRVESELAIRTHGRIGTIVPLHASAPGKAILARLADEAVERLWSDGVEMYNPSTVARLEDLREQLAEVRRRGYAVNHGEWREGVVGFGAAMLDRGGHPFAAISLSMPASRFIDTDLERFGAAVVAAAHTVEQQARFVA